MPDPKFCVDCKWFVPYDVKDAQHLGKCRHEATLARDDDYLVSGVPGRFATNERKYGPCGREGALWEPKP